MPGVRVLSLVRELRSHILTGATTTTTKFKPKTYANVYLTKNSYPDYIKNSYKSTIKR